MKNHSQNKNKLSGTTNAKQSGATTPRPVISSVAPPTPKVAPPPSIIPPPPVTPSVSPAQNTPNTSSTNYISNPFSVVIRGFSNVFEYNRTPIIILLVASTMFYFFFEIFQYFIPKDIFQSINGADFMLGPSILLLVLYMVMNLVITSTSLLVGIQSTRGKSHTLNQYFRYILRQIGKLLGLGVFMSVIVTLGLVFFIVPGILFMYWYCLAPLIIIDQDKNIGEAMTTSKRMMKDKFWEWLGLIVAMSMFGLFGALMPIAYGGGMGQFYQQIKNLEDSESAKPPTHWSNYLAAGALLLILALVISVSTLIAILLISFGA